MNTFQTTGRKASSDFDSSGIYSNAFDSLGDFDLYIPTESSLKIFDPNKKNEHKNLSSNTVLTNKPSYGIGTSFITKTGVDDKPIVNNYSKDINKHSQVIIPENRYNSDYDNKEIDKPNEADKQSSVTVKTLTAKKILFQAKPVLPAKELDSIEANIIYYIE